MPNINTVYASEQLEMIDVEISFYQSFVNYCRSPLCEKCTCAFDSIENNYLTRLDYHNAIQILMNLNSCNYNISTDKYDQMINIYLCRIYNCPRLHKGYAEINIIEQFFPQIGNITCSH